MFAREGGAEELYRALVDAVAGRMHCAPHIAAAMFGRLARLLHQPEPQEPMPDLSPRETEILALVEQGRSNKEIARQLAISVATVKNHMHNILQKLQVSRRGQAAARLRDVARRLSIASSHKTGSPITAARHGDRQGRFGLEL